MNKMPVLYVSRDCHQCNEAIAFFSNHGIEVDIRDIDSTQNMHRLIEITGQSQTPTFESGDFIVTGFTVDEFIDEIDHRPEIRLQLGLEEDL